MVRHLVNMFLALLPPTRLFAFRKIMLLLAGISADKNICFCGRSWIYGRGNLYIGESTWISPGAVIHTHMDADIHIGARCDIGPSVEFITGSHFIGSSHRRAGLGTALPISVGDGCWIGARTVILGGVTIGAGSIVAAGSMVAYDVPANVLVAGVPAKVKRVLNN